MHEILKFTYICTDLEGSQISTQELITDTSTPIGYLYNQNWQQLLKMYTKTLIKTLKIILIIIKTVQFCLCSKNRKEMQ